MYPYLFHKEFLPSYWIMMIAGIFAALFLFRLLARKKSLSDSVYGIFVWLILISLMGGLLGARLFQILYNLIKTQRAGDGITFMGGLVTGIALFFVCYTVVYKRAEPYKKRLLYCDLNKTVNIAAPCIALGHCLGRIGCFLTGCCYGKPTDAWFGIDFVKGFGLEGEWIFYGYKRIPTQLFEAIFLLLLFGICLIFLLKTEGYLPVLIYTYGYSVFRFILEFFRGDSSRAVTGPLSPSQWQSIALFLGAVAVTVWRIKISRPRDKEEKK